MDQPPTYVGTADVARTFGVTHKTVIAWIKAGKLAAIQPSGENGAYRIPSAELERLQRVGPLSDTGRAALGPLLVVLAATLLAVVVGWNAPAGTPLAALLAVGAWYALARLLGAGALAVGRHGRWGGGR